MVLYKGDSKTQKLSENHFSYGIVYPASLSTVRSILLLHDLEEEPQQLVKWLD